VAALLRNDWHESLAREGLAPVAAAPLAAQMPDAEPPCPACGSTAGLDAGACRDCGLQLE
jgi:hypothetical protein